MLQSYIARGGRLVAKSVVAEVRSHALDFKASAVAPVLSASAAWHGDQVINDPEDNDCTKVREGVAYRGAEQATHGNEKGDKK